VRRIFIGDVQGCRQQLEQLLSACGYCASRDVLYATGDLVSKGPDSIGVLRLLRELGAMPVLGNHDLWWLATGRIPDAGVASWLQAQPIVRVMDDLILIHAGLHPRWTERHLASLSPEEVEFATNVRYCDASGQRPPSDWPPPGPPFRPWDDFYRGRKRVVFGHWARRGLACTDKVVGLDTGCCYGGKLSAWIAEEDRIVQVPGWNKS
jgi:bis(5'-nucleosyl)-tetraphosphatase (symmetrical)